MAILSRGKWVNAMLSYQGCWGEVANTCLWSGKCGRTDRGYGSKICENHPTKISVLSHYWLWVNYIHLHNMNTSCCWIEWQWNGSLHCMVILLFRELVIIFSPCSYVLFVDMTSWRLQTHYHGACWDLFDVELPVGQMDWHPQGARLWPDFQWCILFDQISVTLHRI